MDIARKMARKNSDWIKRGAHGGTKRAYRASKRGAKAKALKIELAGM